MRCQAIIYIVFMTILVTFNGIITVACFKENSTFTNNWANHQRPMIISYATSYMELYFRTQHFWNPRPAYSKIPR